MKLLQITDIHLTAPGKTIGGRDPNANFAKALAHATSHHPDAETLIITGDLSDWGEAADYARLKAQLADLPMPVHLCIGNHDDRQTFLNVFPEKESADGFVQQVVPLSMGYAILLDTWGPDTHAGHFCAARADWLSAQLEILEGPIWIFMHADRSRPDGQDHAAARRPLCRHGRAPCRQNPPHIPRPLSYASLWRTPRHPVFRAPRHEPCRLA